MFQEKLYLTLKMDVSGCDFDLILNGVSIRKSMGNGQVVAAGEVAVNKWILPGLNELNLRVFYAEDDPEGARAEARVVLQVRQKDASRSTIVPITRLAFKGADKTEESSLSGRFDSRQAFAPSEKGDVAVHDIVIGPSASMRPGIEVSRTMELPVNFPLWAFAGSDLISDKHHTRMSLDEYAAFSANIKSELLPIYQKIHEALDTGETDPILPLFQERNSELEQAYYFEPGEPADNLALAFHAAAGGAGGTLADIDPDSLYAQVSHNLRLVHLIHPSGRPVIHFTHSGWGMHLVDDIVFRKSGEKWIITR